MTYSHRERTSCEHRGFYRNPYHGWVAGVCAGIAERMGISPIWLRLLTIFGLLTATTLTIRGGFLSHRLNGFLRGQRGKVFRKVPELSAEAIALRSR
jgi:phage shock protein PspC (stress-responsive transcriptional regulator)